MTAKAESESDESRGVQVFAGDGRAPEKDRPDIFRDWPEGWFDEDYQNGEWVGKRKVRRRLKRIDGVRLSYDTGIWIVTPDGKTTRSGHDPEEGSIDPREVMEFANEVYPIGCTEFPPNKYDLRWKELFPDKEEEKPVPFYRRWMNKIRNFFVGSKS